MHSRRLPRLAAAATVAAGLVVAEPASAAVTYDPEAKTGFVGAGDVRGAFGWSDAVLAARAAGLAFGHDFWTHDTYAVSCGGPDFPVVHHRDFGRFELTAQVARDGYGGGPRGFRITGPYAGISGTSVAPAPGGPCPEDRGPAITRASLVSTTTGWTLTVGDGDEKRELLSGRAATVGG